MKRLKEFFDEYCFLLILNCVAIFLSGFSICCNIDSISLENYNIIIGFIGALATFVVISNYVQVIKMERDLKEKIKEELSKNKQESIKAAEEESKKIAKEVFQNMSKFKDKQSQTIAQTLYDIATMTSDLDIRLSNLKKASEECGESETELKTKIERLYEITKQIKEENVRWTDLL